MRHFFHVDQGKEKNHSQYDPNSCVSVVDPSWVTYGQVMIFTGGPGTGKSRMATDMGDKVVRGGYSATKIHGETFLRALAYWAGDFNDMDPVRDLVHKDLIIIEEWPQNNGFCDIAGLQHFLSIRREKSLIVISQRSGEYWARERDNLGEISEDMARVSEKTYILCIGNVSTYQQDFEDDIPF